MKEHKAKAPCTVFPSPPSSHSGSSELLPTCGLASPGFSTEQWPEWQAFPKDSPGLCAGSLWSQVLLGSGLERGDSPSSPHHTKLKWAHLRARGPQEPLTPIKPHPLTMPCSGCTPGPHSGRANWGEGAQSLANTFTLSLRAPASRTRPQDSILCTDSPLPCSFHGIQWSHPILCFPTR